MYPRCTSAAGMPPHYPREGSDQTDLWNRPPANRGLALDGVVHVEDCRRAQELDPGFGQDRHEPLTEGVELFPGLPDLGDEQLALRPEAHVVVEARRGEISGRLERLNGLVVLLGGQCRRAEADDDAHRPKPPARG